MAPIKILIADDHPVVPSWAAQYVADQRTDEGDRGSERRNFFFFVHCSSFSYIYENVKGDRAQSQRIWLSGASALIRFEHLTAVFRARMTRDDQPFVTYNGTNDQQAPKVVGWIVRRRTPQTCLYRPRRCRPVSTHRQGQKLDDEGDERVADDDSNEADRRADEAWENIKKGGWSHWVTIGQALVRARTVAMNQAGVNHPEWRALPAAPLTAVWNRARSRRWMEATATGSSGAPWNISTRLKPGARP